MLQTSFQRLKYMPSGEGEMLRSTIYAEIRGDNVQLRLPPTPQHQTCTLLRRLPYYSALVPCLLALHNIRLVSEMQIMLQTVGEPGGRPKSGAYRFLPLND